MDSLRTFRTVSWLEGFSFLVLVLIAMPLKYMLQIKIGVRVVGIVHGMLFLWFVSTLARTHFERGWSIRTSLRLFVLALVPFGFVWIDRKLRDEIASLPGPQS